MVNFLLVDANADKVSSNTGGRIYNDLLGKMGDNGTISIYTHQESDSIYGSYKVPFYIMIYTPEASIYVMKENVNSFKDTSGEMVYIRADGKYNLSGIDKLVDAILTMNGIQPDYDICKKEDLGWLISADKRKPYRSTLAIDTGFSAEHQVRFGNILAESLGKNHLDGKVYSFMVNDILFTRVTTSISATYISIPDGIELIKEAAPWFTNKGDLNLSNVLSEHIGFDQVNVGDLLANEIASIIRGNIPNPSDDELPFRPKKEEPPEKVAEVQKQSYSYEEDKIGLNETIMVNIIKTNYLIECIQNPEDSDYNMIGWMISDCHWIIEEWKGDVKYAIENSPLNYNKVFYGGANRTLIEKWNVGFYVIDNFVFMFGTEKNCDWFLEKMGVHTAPYLKEKCDSKEQLATIVGMMTKRFSLIHDMWNPDSKKIDTYASISCIVPDIKDINTQAYIDDIIAKCLSKRRMTASRDIRYVYSKGKMEGARYASYKIDKAVTIFVSDKCFPTNEASCVVNHPMNFTGTFESETEELVTAINDILDNGSFTNTERRADRMLLKSSMPKAPIYNKNKKVRGNGNTYILYKTLDEVPGNWKYREDMKDYLQDRDIGHRVMSTNQGKLLSYVMYNSNVIVLIYHDTIDKKEYQEGTVLTHLIEVEGDPYATFDDLTHILDDALGVAQIPDTEDGGDMDFGDESEDDEIVTEAENNLRDYSEGNTSESSSDEVDKKLESLTNNPKYKAVLDELCKIWSSTPYGSIANNTTSVLDLLTAEPKEEVKEDVKEDKEMKNIFNDGVQPILLSDIEQVNYTTRGEKIRIAFKPDCDQKDIDDLMDNIRSILSNALNDKVVMNFDMKSVVTNCHYGRDRRNS